MKKRINTRDYIRRIAATAAALLTALAVHAQVAPTTYYCGCGTSLFDVSNGVILLSSGVNASYRGECTSPNFTVIAICKCFRVNIIGNIEGVSHSWGNWTHIADATCTTAGYDEHTCNRCGTTERQNETPPLGHDWSGWTAIAATCTTGGYEERTCRRSGCGATERQNETSPLGHMFGADNICSQCGLAMLLDNSANDIDALAGSQRDVLIGGRSIYRDGDWNTLCLPFALPTLAGTPLEGFTVMELDGQASNLSDGMLTLNFTEATSIEAGKPYILKWPIPVPDLVIGTDAE